MSLANLKQKVEKRQAELKALEKQIREEEKGRLKLEEQSKKLEAILPEIANAIQTVLDNAKVSIPDGKRIIISVGSTGINSDIISTKRDSGQGRGAKSIVFEGQTISWAKLCTLKNIARTVGGSAHRDVYNKAKELHDSIAHTCVIDSKVYPIVNKEGTEN